MSNTNVWQSSLWLAALILFSGGCASTSTYRVAGADVAPERIVSVWIPVMLDPLTIDGRPVDRDLIPLTERYRYELAPGVHEIVVRYAGFTDVPDQLEIVRSAPVSVTLNGLPGRHYLLEYDAHDQGIRLKEANILPDVSVVDITANAALIGAWERKSRPGQSPAAPKPAAPVNRRVEAPLSSPTNPAVLKTAGPAVLGQLQQSWRQAGESERGEFMQWTVTQTAVDPASSGALQQLQATWRQAGDIERGQFLKWTTRRE